MVRTMAVTAGDWDPEPPGPITDDSPHPSVDSTRAVTPPMIAATRKPKRRCATKPAARYIRKDPMLNDSYRIPPNRESSEARTSKRRTPVAAMRANRRGDVTTGACSQRRDKRSMPSRFRGYRRWRGRRPARRATASSRGSWSDLPCLSLLCEPVVRMNDCLLAVLASAD
jgi:hypothetical protein